MTPPDARTATRPPLLRQALLAAVTSAVLMGLAHAGQVPLVVGVGLAQLLLVLGLLAVVDAPAGLGIFVISCGAALAADVVVVVSDGDVGDLAGVVALSFVAGLLHQLVRRHRSRVTEALADTLVAVVLVVGAACLPAVLDHADGEVVLRAGLLAAGAALVVARVADLLVRSVAVAPDASRSWPGLALGLTTGVALAVAEAGDDLAHRDAMLVGLAAATTAMVADVFVDLSANEVVGTSAEERRRPALLPVVTVLPFSLAGPVLLVAARLLERA